NHNRFFRISETRGTKCKKNKPNILIFFNPYQNETIIGRLRWKPFSGGDREEGYKPSTGHKGPKDGHHVVKENLQKSQIFPTGSSIH
ncbi:MAG: hypothetical protein QNJ97_17500, partial [Myxococcota bacterium]|nr:hypothetical protein [Myxococcota bacterium]